MARDDDERKVQHPAPQKEPLRKPGAPTPNAENDPMGQPPGPTPAPNPESAPGGDVVGTPSEK